MCVCEPSLCASLILNIKEKVLSKSGCKESKLSCDCPAVSSHFHPEVFETHPNKREVPNDHHDKQLMLERSRVSTCNGISL